MNGNQPVFGDTSDQYPAGYGYCQCGCGRKTGKLRNGKYATYVSGHHPLAVERKQLKNASNKPILRSLHRCAHIEDDLNPEGLEYLRHHLEIGPLSNNGPLSNEIIAMLYHKYGLPVSFLAKEIGCTPRAIYSKMKSIGVSRRTIGQSRSIRLNSSFFNQWTPEMAWVLGLCFTDGYFSNNQVRLCLTDLDAIEKARNLLGKYLKVKTRTHPTENRQTQYCITFGNEEMAEDLKGLGLLTKKSLIMPFPKVPNTYMRHFLRGCWDGDGGFSFTGGKLFAHYTCGSLPFIERVAEELYEAGVNQHKLRKASARTSTAEEREAREYEIISLRERFGNGPYPLRVYKRKHAKAYDLRFASDEQHFQLFELFYEDVDSSIYMDRKQQKLREYLISKNVIV